MIIKTTSTLAAGWNSQQLFSEISSQVDISSWSSGESNPNSVPDFLGLLLWEERALSIQKTANGVEGKAYIGSNMTESELSQNYLFEPANTDPITVTSYRGPGVNSGNYGEEYSYICHLICGSETAAFGVIEPVHQDWSAEYVFAGIEPPAQIVVGGDLKGLRDSIPQISKPYPNSDRYIQHGVVVGGDRRYETQNFALIASSGLQIGDEVIANNGNRYDLLSADGFAVKTN